MSIPHATQTVTVPPQGLRFAAAVTFAAAPSDGGPRRFSGVAYGGGVITDHGYWDAVAFDLAGLHAKVPMPLLLQHDPQRTIGVIDAAVNDGQQLRIEGELFTGIDHDADAVAAKADRGAPWQLSVGVFPDRVETLNGGAPQSINGRSVEGAVTVFRASRVREASFVALGADHTTSATVFHQSGGHVAQLVTQEPTMADKDHTAEIAAITAERDAERTRADAEKARADASEAKFAAREKSERESAVKALLGDEFAVDKAAPYMSMTAEQFAVVQERETKHRSRLPEGFDAEQATGGAAGTDGNGDGVLVAAARRMYGLPKAA